MRRWQTIPMPGRWQTIPIVGEAVRDLFRAEQVVRLGLGIGVWSHPDCSAIAVAEAKSG
jgi:hypothetical protein